MVLFLGPLFFVVAQFELTDLSNKVFCEWGSAWQPTTWPANNCPQIMVCSYVVLSKWVLLKIIFCSCIMVTMHSGGKCSLLPRAVRKWFKYENKFVIKFITYQTQLSQNIEICQLMQNTRETAPDFSTGLRQTHKSRLRPSRTSPTPTMPSNSTTRRILTNALSPQKSPSSLISISQTTSRKTVNFCSLGPGLLLLATRRFVSFKPFNSFL